MSKTLPLNIDPRGLNIRQVSAYWGVSPGTFKKLVRLGLAPEPIHLPGLDRQIWDRLEIDRAMDAARRTEAVA
jgi:predicted DNA-binding transcriptional regulator AlpA